MILIKEKLIEMSYFIVKYFSIHDLKSTIVYIVLMIIVLIVLMIKFIISNNSIDDKSNGLLK